MNPPSIRADPGPGERIGRFEVQGELGHGGMANVLEVVDTANGAHLALKLMNRTSPELVERFEREFDTLSRLSHPNVLRVIERGRAGDRPYYVMEYLRGRELKEVVESWKEISPQERFRRAEKILVQIAKALEHIHRRGLVHRDVTPSNIFVLDDGTAKLMDFGVVRDPGADSAAQEELVGTVAYMAPEQITSARVDARADLYSLGAVLYLMLTGRRPFNSRTLAGYLEKHLHQAVKPPRTIHPTLPEKLDRICMSLLEKNPDDRISSATHLLRLLEGEPHAKGALGDLPLVGRARELSQIREIVGGLLSGHGAVVVLEGGAGLGKGRMATELVQQAERAGIIVHRASNAAPDQRAFEGYRSIYRELRAALRDRSVHPALEATFRTGEPSGEVYDRRVVLEEMRKLAAAAGRRLVVIDNLDLADAATIDLTEYLARNLVGVDRAPFVLVLTRQTPTDGASDPLASLLDGSSTGVTPIPITLGPISVSAVEELLLSVVQDEPRVRPLAERLQVEGSGNPYVITEMVETLVQEGLLIPGPGGELGHLAPGAFERAQALPVPRTIRDLWRARVAPVCSADLQVLRTLAASPEPLDLELVAAGSALEQPEIERALDELLERGLARLHDGPDEEHYELGLARLRDVLIEDADDAVLAAIHQRLGAFLERRHRKNPDAALEVMAFHFERARVPAKAYQYLLSSAERQLSRGYRREALALLDRAMAMEDAARISLLLEDADRLLAEGLLSRARALHHLGRWEEAEATAAKAEATALELGHDWLLSKVLAVRSEILRFTRGSDVARELAREALEKAKHASDPKLEVEPLFDLGGLAWERGELEHARQYWLEGLAKAQSLSLEAFVARGYGGLGVVAICRGQLAEARRYLEQAYETCDRLGLVEALAVNGCNLVELHHFSGHLRKGLDLADRVVARTREVQYPFGTALGLRYRALMLVDIGQLQGAEESAVEALRIVEALGDDHTRFETLVVLVRVALAKRELGQAAHLLEIALPLGAASDTEGFVPLLHAWRAWLEASRGETDAARDDLARAEERVERVWPHQRVRLLLNIARVHEALDEPLRARDRAEAALRLADSNGFRYYAMRGRQILARVSHDEAVVARNARVADALARSLAANLPEDEGREFLEIQSRSPR